MSYPFSASIAQAGGGGKMRFVPALLPSFTNEDVNVHEDS